MARMPLAPPAPVAFPEAPPRWHTHDWNRAAVYRWGAPVLGALPRRARLALASAVASVVRFPAERAVVRGNLARIAAGLPAGQRERLARQVFSHFAMCFADLISTNRRTPALAPLLAAVEGRERLEAAMAEARGLILMTAHLGNWELAGRILALRFARPTHVVVATEPDPGVERFLRGAPAPVRFVTRSHPTAVVRLLAALRRNEIVALQGDRALGTRGDVAVDFFGAPALFPLGPFVLARAAGAPVVPAFCVLGADRRYTVSLGEAIRVAAEGETVALRAWVRVLEEAVRRHPEQWFNFFDCWSTRPAL